MKQGFRLPKLPPGLRRSVKKAMRLCGWALGVWVLAFAALTAWHGRQSSGGFLAEESEARTLALTYDAVRLAPKPFWNKPVLWRVGCQDRRATTCYYEGDLNKPVRFPDGTEVPGAGHKGMSFCLVLGRVQRVDPQGVFLGLLEAKGTRE